MSGHEAQKRLAFAAEYGDVPHVLRLLSEGVDAKADDSWALRLAASNGHTECVRLLIRVSDPKAQNSAALVLAADRGGTECVEMLIQVSDPKTYNSQALQRAAKNEHLDVVDLLFEVSDPRKALQQIVEDFNKFNMQWQDHPGVVYLQQKITAQNDNAVLHQHVDFDGRNTTSQHVPRKKL